MHKSISELQAIIWDFDGVLMDSNKVRDFGFKEVLKDFPKNQIDQLMRFHQQNGGLSRYVKFRYFFEKIRKEEINEDEVNNWAAKFSKVMLQLLMNPNLLINTTLNFVKDHHKEIPMHIVSGSDQNELRAICKNLKIDQYFQSIHGSPKPKTRWVSELIEFNEYLPNECVLIGDSINDYEAAKDNGLHFMGYNNKEVEGLSTIQISFL